MDILTRFEEAVCTEVLNFGPLIGSSIVTFQINVCSLSSSLFLKEPIIGKVHPLIRQIFLHMTFGSLPN